MPSPSKRGPASATATPEPHDAEATRRIIVVRLMRAHCERLGGCTRACRRQRRCVAADRVEREGGIEHGRHKVRDAERQ